jgi:hypothetical protein
MNELTQPREAAALGDLKQIFGEQLLAHAGEPVTEDSWANHDRIAPRYAERLRKAARRNRVVVPRLRRNKTAAGPFSVQRPTRNPAINLRSNCPQPG